MLWAQLVAQTHTTLYKKCRFSERQMYLPECIKMVITQLVINVFFMKLTPLHSAHIELSIHVKNFDEKSPMVPFLIAGHICLYIHLQYFRPCGTYVCDDLHQIC